MLYVFTKVKDIILPQTFLPRLLQMSIAFFSDVLECRSQKNEFKLKEGRFKHPKSKSCLIVEPITQRDSGFAFTVYLWLKSRDPTIENTLIRIPSLNKELVLMV